MQEAVEEGGRLPLHWETSPYGDVAIFQCGDFRVRPFPLVPHLMRLFPSLQRMFPSPVAHVFPWLRMHMASLSAGIVSAEVQVAKHNKLQPKVGSFRSRLMCCNCSSDVIRNASVVHS